MALEYKTTMQSKNESSVKKSGVEIPTTTSISYSFEEKDEGLFAVKMVTNYDQDALAPFVVQFFGQMKGMSDKGKNNHGEFENFMSKAKMQMTEYRIVAINSETTWPVVARYIRDNTIKAGGKTRQKIQERIIYDKGEE